MDAREREAKARSATCTHRGGCLAAGYGDGADALFLHCGGCVDYTTKPKGPFYWLGSIFHF